MHKVISFILVLVLVLSSSALVFAEDSAEKDTAISETRGSNTKYFYDNTGNRYKVVGTTTASGSYGSASTNGSLYRPLDNDYANFYGVTVTVTAGTAVTFTDYTTDYSTLSQTVPFAYPYTGAIAGNSYTFDKLIYNLTCSHETYTNNGGSVSFVTLVLTQQNRLRLIYLIAAFLFMCSIRYPYQIIQDYL